MNRWAEFGSSFVVSRKHAKGPCCMRTSWFWSTVLRDVVEHYNWCRGGLLGDFCRVNRVQRCTIETHAHTTMYLRLISISFRENSSVASTLRSLMLIKLWSMVSTYSRIFFLDLNAAPLICMCLFLLLDYLIRPKMLIYGRIIIFFFYLEAITCFCILSLK